MTPAEERLRGLLEDSFMDVAEIMRDADEDRDRTYQRCLELRARCARVWKMAGLGEPPSFDIERRVTRVG